jgi:hypothetical protein
MVSFKVQLNRVAPRALLAGSEVRLLCSALRVVCWHVDVDVAVSGAVHAIWTIDTRQTDGTDAIKV